MKHPTFYKASLHPSQITATCPFCDGQWEMEPEEDEAGGWHIPEQDRYQQCDMCEQYVDLGHDGFSTIRGHDEP